jgi:hypothetical protein
MTNTQKLVFQNVLRQTLAGKWYRAAGNGERVTLASLYRNGALIRRVWKRESTPYPAHEYLVSPDAIEALKEATA